MTAKAIEKWHKNQKVLKNQLEGDENINNVLYY